MLQLTSGVFFVSEPYYNFHYIIQDVLCHYQDNNVFTKQFVVTLNSLILKTMQVCYHNRHYSATRATRVYSHQPVIKHTMKTWQFWVSLQYVCCSMTLAVNTTIKYCTAMTIRYTISSSLTSALDLYK